MSSLQSHGASHMAGFMPKGMQETGTAMHQAASRFAVSAQETAVTRDLPGALGALSRVTAQCVACHASYRLK
jgi:cytochrome c556